MKASGKYTVSGPYEEPRKVESVGQGCAVAQTWATKHREHAQDGVKYHVTDPADNVLAVIVLEEDGSVTTLGHSLLVSA